MHHKLRNRVEDAQDYVECDPGKREPARPIVSAEQEYSTNNRQAFGEFDRRRIGMTCQQLTEVDCKSDRAHRQIDAGEDRD